MCIYCNTTNYRKIYENHHGPIPKEKDGRSYEIHHIDGNHANNSPDNLMAITIQEHYNIHYLQEDFFACYLIATQRMNKSPREISELAKKNVSKQINDGKNAFVGGDIQREVNKRRISDGTHHLLKRPDGTSHASDKVKSGTHIFSRKADGTSLTKTRTALGQNPFSKRSDGSSLSLDMVNAGTHHLLGKDHSGENNPSYDHTLYTFKHKVTGEIVEMTQYNLSRQYDLNKSNVNAMIKGRKSCGGWIRI
jgi:hypothetical protein